MIRLDRVTKRYAGAVTPAVDELVLEVPEGCMVALVGPSGCGKTTTLRMVNRLIEPSSGQIFVAGEDVTHGDPVLLRRRIGYVIQQVGLFPHMTIAQNIAAVPDLLGWPAARGRARAEELLDLVGLDQGFANRYPRQLSGGQRQRVGVARALAADPPVLLMDEPFGAIDPIARTRLQDEFRRILQQVRKTVVMVTHDLDEAIRMGDRLAIMRGGRLVQYDTPDAVLAHPADAFVEAFVGPDRALKRLSLLAVDALMQPDQDKGASHPAAPPGTNLRDALSLMIAAGSDRLRVVDEAGVARGVVWRDAIFALQGATPKAA
jgi:osmoprotectant transport system ATP-binding protein